MANRVLTEAEKRNFVFTLENIFRREEAMRRGQGESDEQFLDYVNKMVPLSDRDILQSLKPAIKYNATICKRRVERYLITPSKMHTVDKWRIAKKYKLDRLKAHCLIEAQITAAQNAATLARLKRLGLLPGMTKKKPEAKKEEEAGKLGSTSNSVSTESAESMESI